MFNTQVFNELPFNSVKQIIDNKEDLNFYLLYNDFYLCDQEITFATIKYLNPKELKYEETNFWNFWSIFNFQEWKKQIEITWSIRTSDRNSLIEKLQEMKYRLYQKNKNLVIKDWEKKYQIKGVFTNIELNENHYNINWMNFKLLFETYDYLQNYTPTNGFINTTSNNLSFTITNDGTAQSKLYMVLNFKTATSTTSASLTIWSQTITINETITNSDVLVLDGYDTLITKNWNLVNFNGEIPLLEVWDNTVTITTNGTVNIDIVYKTNLAYK